MAKDNEMDVARRAKVIDWMKTEMTEELAQLFRGLWEGKEARVIDSLASLVVSCYVLSRRLGLSFRDLDEAVAKKVKEHRGNQHQLEAWYGDMSALERHMDGR